MSSLLNRIQDAWARWHAIRRPTMFGTALIYQMRWGADHVRVLDMDGSLQSATYLNDRWCNLPFPYLRNYNIAFECLPQVRTMCMLGGGGYAYPKHVIAHHDPTRIDVVEIDPAITKIARRYFYLDRLCRTYQTEKTGRLRLVCADATDYLHACARDGKRYDVILNDCYVSREPNAELALPEGAALVRACLEPQGVYLSNVISALEGADDEVLWRTVVALGSAFAHVMVMPSKRVEPDEIDNVMVLATDGDYEPQGMIRLYDAV